MRSIARRIVFGVGVLITVFGAALVGYSLFGTGAILTSQSRPVVQINGNEYLIAEVRYVRCDALRLIIANDHAATPWHESNFVGRTSVEEALGVARNYVRWKLQKGELQSAELVLEAPPIIRFKSLKDWRVGPLAYWSNRSDDINNRALSVPTWPIPLIGLAILATTGPLSVGAFKRRSRVRRGACVACGYDRRSLAADVACPECGGGSGATTRL